MGGKWCSLCFDIDVALEEIGRVCKSSTTTQISVGSLQIAVAVVPEPVSQLDDSTLPVLLLCYVLAVNMIL